MPTTRWDSFLRILPKLIYNIIISKFCSWPQLLQMDLQTRSAVRVTYFWPWGIIWIYFCEIHFLDRLDSFHLVLKIYLILHFNFLFSFLWFGWLDFFRIVWIWGFCLIFLFFFKCLFEYLDSLGLNYFESLTLSPCQRA